MNKNTDKLEKIAIILIFIIIISIGIFSNIEKENKNDNIVTNNEVFYNISDIPQYNGNVYVQINDNIPTFSNEDMNIEEDYYSDLVNGKVRNGYGKNKLDKS
jgi:hypothetical protein